VTALTALLSRLEELDRQIEPAVPSTTMQSKLVKETLRTRQEVRDHLRRRGEMPTDSERCCRLRKFLSGTAYNIDRLFHEYGSTITCPSCQTSDVALVRHLANPLQRTEFHHHHNQRLRLVYGDTAPQTGTFACNRCHTGFQPDLPPTVFKLCQMLYAYY
jgi:hypothetical protein